MYNHRSPSCTFECAFCEGTGRVDSMGFLQDCEVCGGVGKLTMNVSCSSLLECARCEGTGRTQSMGYLQPCSVCNGRGRVKR